MNKKIQARFDELEKDIIFIIATRYTSYQRFSDGATYIDNQLYIAWTMKVKSLFVLCIGEESMYYKSFITEMVCGPYSTNNDIFEILIPIFKAAKDDYENGIITSLRALITAEVFDNELEQAQELLDNKYHVPAAVIAGTVLETALRELCDAQTPPILHGKLDKMNADLKKAGAYNQLQSKRITALAEIRNSAAHGKNSEFTHKDVEDMIRDIQSFLANHLSD